MKPGVSEALIWYVPNVIIVANHVQFMALLYLAAVVIQDLL